MEDIAAAGALREVALSLKLGTMRDLLAAGEAAARSIKDVDTGIRLKAALDLWVTQASKRIAQEAPPASKRASSTAPGGSTKAPETLKALIQWTKKLGIDGELKTSAQDAKRYLGDELAWAVAYLSPTQTIEDLLKGQGLARGVTSESAPARALRRGAVRFLEARAKTAEARALMAAMPEEVRAVHEALGHLADHVRLGVPCAHESPLTPSLELDETSATVRVTYPGARATDGAFNVVFALNFAGNGIRLVVERAGSSQRDPLGRVDLNEPPAALKTWLSPKLAQRVVESVSAVQKTLYEQAPLAEQLRTLLVEPAWRRLFRLAETILAPENVSDSAQERLVWVLDPREDSVAALPASVRLRKDGLWGKPTVRSSDWLLESLGTLEGELRDCALMWLAAHNIPERAQHLAAEGTLLSKLALLGALLTKEGQPVVFKRTALTLRLAPHGDGAFVMKGELGGSPVSWGEVRAAKGALLRVRGQVVYWAEVPKTVLSLIDAGFFESLDVPQEALDALLERIVPLQEGVHFAIPSYIAGREVAADNATKMVLEREAGGRLDVRLMVRPLPGGALHEPGEGAPMIYGWSGGERSFSPRQLVEERRNAQRLHESLGLERLGRDVGQFHYKIRTPEAASELLRTLQNIDPVPEIAWRGVLAPLRRSATLARSTLRLSLLAGEGNLQVAQALDEDGQAFAMEALLDVVRRGGNVLTTDDGELREIGAELQRWLVELDARLSPDAATPTLTRAALVGWQEAWDGFGIEEDAGARLLRDAIDQANQEDLVLPEKFEKLLRPYQKDGLRWLMGRVKANVGACLADDMGLGKTLQSITLLSMRASDGPALVVCPTSVATTWEAELARFAPELNLIVYRGTKRKALLQRCEPGTVLLASYDIMARDAEDLAQTTWSTLIFDEAHYLKNVASRRREAAAELQAESKVALTGTPLENHLGELWSLMDLLNPGLLGTYEYFRTNFVAAMGSEDAQARLEMLRRRLKGVILRRTKRDVAPELPPRTESVRWIELNSEERERYRGLQREALEHVSQPEGAGGGKRRFEMLAWLTRLRQLVCHPRLLDPDYSDQSSKLEAALSLIEDALAAQQRILVFSQFTSLLKLLRESLDARFIQYLYLDGATPTTQRAASVEAWQKARANLFLLSLKAGGTGLNLTGSDYVLLLDPWWNPAVEDQASDRAHRIGQKKPVSVVRFVCEQTVEESVLELHSRKRATARSVLEGDEALGTLSDTELETLIRHGLT